MLGCYSRSIEQNRAFGDSRVQCDALHYFGLAQGGTWCLPTREHECRDHTLHVEVTRRDRSIDQGETWRAVGQDPASEHDGGVRLASIIGLPKCSEMGPDPGGQNRRRGARG